MQHSTPTYNPIIMLFLVFVLFIILNCLSILFYYFVAGDPQHAVTGGASDVTGSSVGQRAGSLTV